MGLKSPDEHIEAIRRYKEVAGKLIFRGGECEKPGQNGTSCLPYLVGERVLMGMRLLLLVVLSIMGMDEEARSGASPSGDSWGSIWCVVQCGAVGMEVKDDEEQPQEIG